MSKRYGKKRLAGALEFFRSARRCRRVEIETNADGSSPYSESRSHTFIIAKPPGPPIALVEELAPRHGTRLRRFLRSRVCVIDYAAFDPGAGCSVAADMLNK